MTTRDPEQMDAFLQQVGHHTTSLIVYINGDLTIHALGPHSEKTLGYEELELDGKPLSTIVGDECLDFIRSVMGKAIEGELTELEKEIGLFPKDGQMRAFRMLLFPIKDTSGDVKLCIYGRDVSEWRESMNALELMNKKLNILGSATRHDVLNSLTGLFGYLELAEVKCKDETVTKFIRKAKGSAEIVKKQIEFTRMYQEIGSKKPTWLNVSDITRAAYVSLNERRLNLEVDVGALQVYADPMMEKVLHNLMDNAQRHAEGATRIKITFFKVDDVGKLVIEDDGKGVAVEE
ncbi:MAG TPA: PAS domain S-box protein, partial [Methanomassiliicoccales archaeon]|nr:PAS domain S-box protein [Methanomassiliicoccales archaeon]